MVDIKDMVESIMDVQKASWKMGYDTGYRKGYLDGLKKAQEISKEVFGPKKEVQDV